MGDADQFIKRIFLDETARATGDAAAFAQAPEIATPSLTPDGILTLLAATADGADLAAPWTLFEYRAVLDFKMEGDHVDRYVLARVELRRQAAWVHHLERERPKGAEAQPGRYATVVVAPHLPDWLTDREELGPLTVTHTAPGCYTITPRDHPVVWVAANDLPLHPSLVPFLWARSGRPMVRFARWLAGQRGVAAVVAVIQSHPIGSPDHPPAHQNAGRTRARA